jgi:hypothetical protein
VELNSIKSTECETDLFIVSKKMETTNMKTQKTQLKWNFARIPTALFVALTLGACSPGFKTAGSNDSNGSSGTGPVTPVPAPPPSASDWNNLKLDGQVSGGPFGNNIQVIAIDKVAKELIFRLPLPTIEILGGATVGIPLAKLPGATMSIETAPDGTSVLALHIPLRYIIKGATFLEPGKLPNGDPIPGVPDGELPSFAINLANSKSNATFYIAPTTFSIYVNTPFASPFSLTLPIRNAAHTQTTGYISVLMAKPPSKDGGLFLSFKLPGDLARIIDDNL